MYRNNQTNRFLPSNGKDKYDSPIPQRKHTYMSADDIASGKKSQWFELEITGPVRNLSPTLWKLRHLTSLYLNDNHLYCIPPGISLMVCLTHLDLSSNNLRTLPPELGDLVLLRELLLTNNDLRILPYEVGKLFRIQLLGLAGNPLPHELTSIYNEKDGTRKLLNFLLDHLTFNDVQRPPERTWIGVSNMVDDHRSALCELTVMCYNVLCDKYATRQMYGYCPNWALTWNYRRKGIMNEIRQSEADIISLQEVETDQFFNFFLPELKKDGYDGIFSPKSRAKTMSENERKYVDGCAIFYKTSKLKLLQDRLVEFNQLAMANAEGSDDMLNRVMTKDNIGLAALFHTLEGAWSSPTPEPHQPLLVCTAHIHWDPEYCDVKLIQTMMLMHEIRRIAEDTVRKLRPVRGTRTHPPDVNSLPLLLCGDLNSLPDSGVIEFLLNCGVSPNHPDFKELGYRTCLQKLSSTNTPNLLTHPFKMACAYSDDVMPYTNYTFDFKGIIDYIFYSKQHLRLLSLLGPVDMDWLNRAKVVGCPHPHIPSDHFSLVVKLQLISPLFQSPSNGLRR